MSSVSSPLFQRAQMQHILVTGGTGFIGSHLVRALCAAGHRCSLLVRDTRRAQALFGTNCNYANHFAALDQHQKYDLIINLAGAPVLGPRWSERRMQVLHASRSGLTQQLIDWMAGCRHPVAQLINGSAIGYYGIQAQDDPRALDESAPPQEIFMSQLCQRWEQTAAQAHALGCRVSVLRMGVVLGPQGALAKLLLPIRLGMGGPLAGGGQVLSWIHLLDVLRAIDHIWQQGSHDPHTTLHAYNLTAPHTPKQVEFARCAASLLHRPCVLPTPGFAMRWLLGQQSELLLEGQRVIPARLQQEGFVHQFPTLESALRDLILSNGEKS